MALVIGNGAYAVGPLKNPVNDARAMTAALERCGFAVAELENATREQMAKALRKFGNDLQGGGVGLFYFAGHGLQVKGRNYLMPVDADVASEDEVAYSTLDAEAVLAKLETARNRLNIMILDACRNNPFGHGSREGQQGLAQMDAPAGTYIAFATSPGHTASDGNGANGLYSQNLLAQLAVPGAKLEDVFKRVRASVMEASQGLQVPWESSSITGDFYFSGQGPAAQGVSESTLVELTYWDSIKGSAAAEDYRAYLARYPEGTFSHRLIVTTTNRRFNEMVYQMPRLFPDAEAENKVIILRGPGEDRAFSVLMSDHLPDLHAIHGGQCFPYYLYDEPAEAAQPSLFPDENASHHMRREAITNEGLAYFQAAYPGVKIAKEDIFFYVYGLLHSPDYREQFADNLGKELPRIPCVSTATDFWVFSQAGRALADLHLNYETVAPYSIEIVAPATLVDASYPVDKMRYGKAKVDGKTVDDKSVLVYNDHITLKGIPLEAYDYIVNGKSALDWVVERQCVKTDKDSGIVNDANDWATETMGTPKYPLELFMRVITVSIETMKIVGGLPPLTLQAEPVSGTSIEVAQTSGNY